MKPFVENHLKQLKVEKRFVKKQLRIERLKVWSVLVISFFVLILILGVVSTYVSVEFSLDQGAGLAYILVFVSILF